MPRTKDTRTQTKQNTQNGFTKDGFSVCFFSSKILQLVLLLLLFLLRGLVRLLLVFLLHFVSRLVQHTVSTREREKREKTLGKPDPRTTTQ